MADTLTITDNRTGRTYELPVQDGAIRAIDLRQITTGADDFGLMTYDPAFTNTASCRSAITRIDGDRGILEYRGYPIEQVAEHGTYLETAFLLLSGRLPTPVELSEWNRAVAVRAVPHESAKRLMESFRHDAHPMSMLVAGVAALSTLDPDARQVRDAAARRRQALRLIGSVPTLASWAFRHVTGQAYVYPDQDLSFAGNVLAMIFSVPGARFQPHPVLERALDVLFVLHADHEQNCSTSTMRGIGSSEADACSAVAGAIAALYGPLHGGANEQVVRMLQEIGSVRNVPAFIREVKAGEGRKLMGFGHRVYKSYDPRARIVKRTADMVFEVTGRDPLLDVALELERIALEDDYFVSRRLYPNVDFYSGLIYRAMGFPVQMFPVLFAIPRTSGWLAQWEEMAGDPDQKIARPRQIYTGAARRDYVPIDRR